MKMLLTIIVIVFLINSNCTNESSNNPISNNSDITLSKPTLIYPPNNATNIDTTTTLSWIGGSSSNDSMSFIVSVSEYSSFYDISVFNTTLCSLKITNMEMDKIYYWKISCTSNNSVAVSDTFRFYTKESLPGGIVKLHQYMSSYNGYPTGNDIEIIWKLYPNAIGYNVYYKACGDTVFVKETSGHEISVTGYYNTKGRDRIVHSSGTYIYKVCAVGSTGAEIFCSDEKAIVYNR